MNSIEKHLNGHDSIAWDFDNTLIGNRNSLAFQDYILRTPHKKHYILTYRTDGLLQRIPLDLHINTNSRIKTDHFHGIYGIPNNLYQKGFSQDHNTIKRIVSGARGDFHEEIKLISPPFFEKTFGVSIADFIKLDKDCFNFKPEKCKQIGATILIDDMVENQKIYCKENNISLLDSVSLFLYGF